MQKITPFLWFTSQAEEAVNLYVSLFKNSNIGDILRYDQASAKASGQPEGSVLTVDFQLCGQNFGAINGGTFFKLTPALSLFVHCETEEEADGLWAKLSDGGEVLMEYGVQPWSAKYGWLNDRFGVSWQISFDKAEKQMIAPAMLFVGDKYGKAEEAITFYTSLFPHSSINMVAKNGPENPTEKEGTIQYANFTLNGQEFNAMEGNSGHHFTFTPATSFAVNCETQEEIDKYWNALSAVPDAEQCGWLTDKYGISWQIVPTLLQKYLMEDSDKSHRVMEAMLTMKKIEIAPLQEAYNAK
jgi:predicted 3-demethylubiquinone-9 3-methyltransferase (glyoxalase superfamily)